MLKTEGGLIMSRGGIERNKRNFANLVLNHMDNHTNNNDQIVNNENLECATDAQIIDSHNVNCKDKP
jgi:hypothetical protein